MKVKSLSRVRLFATPWTAAYQAPPSMGFFQARVLEWVAIAFSPSTLLPRYSKCGLLTNFNGILQSLLEMQNLESLARTTESELVF